MLALKAAFTSVTWPEDFLLFSSSSYQNGEVRYREEDGWRKLGYEGIVHDSAADMTLPRDPATRNVLIAVRESNPGCRLQIVSSR